MHVNVEGVLHTLSVCLEVNLEGCVFILMISALLWLGVPL